jgi:hypothetical protein
VYIVTGKGGYFFSRTENIVIIAILADKNCKSIKNSTKLALMCLNQYLFSTNRSPDFSTYSKVELDKLLASFYVDARKKFL